MTRIRYKLSPWEISWSQECESQRRAAIAKTWRAVAKVQRAKGDVEGAARAMWQASNMQLLRHLLSVGRADRRITHWDPRGATTWQNETICNVWFRWDTKRSLDLSEVECGNCLRTRIFRGVKRSNYVLTD
jgi:hypothetical protein